MVCVVVGGRGGHCVAGGGNTVKERAMVGMARPCGLRFVVGIVGGRTRLGDGLAVLLQTMACPLAHPPSDIFFPSAAFRQCMYACTHPPLA